MIIVLSPEQNVENETQLVNAFFAEGLHAFHVRKYGATDEEISAYLNGLHQEFRNKIVLHSHHHLASKFGICSLHFREADRIKNEYLPYKQYKLSTSVHSIDAFNKLASNWYYAFLSPIFTSISKVGYGSQHTVLNDLKHRHNHNVKLIGLGGITPENIRQVISLKANGVALLGSVWQSSNPLKTFLSCMKCVR